MAILDSLPGYGRPTPPQHEANATERGTDHHPSALLTNVTCDIRGCNAAAHTLWNLGAGHLALCAHHTQQYTLPLQLAGAHLTQDDRPSLT